MVDLSLPPMEPLLASEEGDDDSDDGLGASVASSSTSLASSIMRYREENGRTYHAFRAGRYVLPNDEAENERLDLQHHLCTLTLGGKLFASPAGRDRPLNRVLDAGTGTGIWAMDFADENPGSDVTGVDLSPIQPSFVPPNVSFYIDDLEDEWSFSYKFDFIYSRMLTASISDWPKFLQQSYDHLNPGGWIELLDVHLELKSDDGTIPDDCAVAKWGDYMVEAAAKLNRPLDSMTFYKQQLLDVGFTNATQNLYKWPTNSWPKDRKFKEIGTWPGPTSNSLFNRAACLRDVDVREPGQWRLGAQHGPVHARSRMEVRRGRGVPGRCAETDEGPVHSRILAHIRRLRAKTRACVRGLKAAADTTYCSIRRGMDSPRRGAEGFCRSIACCGIIYCCFLISFFSDITPPPPLSSRRVSLTAAAHTRYHGPVYQA